MYPQGYTTGDEDDTADFLDTRGHPDSLPTYKGKYMGEMADFVNEQFNDLDPDWDESDWGHVSKRPTTPAGFWRMKNGRLIRIRSMEDAHLRNSIALCKRVGAVDFLQPLMNEQYRRAELAEAAKEKNDPVYRAFKAGWNSGYKSSSEYHCPDIGMSMPETLSDAWKRFNEETNT